MGERDNPQQLLEEQLNGLRAQIEAITESTDMQKLCNSFLDDAVTEISGLKNITKADTHSRIDTLALYLSSLATCLSTHFSAQVREIREKAGDDARMKKGVHDLIVDVAQAKAARKWSEDTEQRIRMSEMREIIWSEMIDDGFSCYLPSNRESFHKWITPAAPAYARAPGRPKENK